MEKFSGFPGRMQFTPIPNVFLSTLLPQISDLAELKTTLYLLATLYRKRGYPRFATFEELRGNKSLMSSLKDSAATPEEGLRNALEVATNRGTFLQLVLERDGAAEDIYFLNTEADREIITRIQNGELELPGLKARQPIPVDTEEPLDIFTLYEQNIGLLTPMIADELREAEKLYPEDWIKAAIKEAVDLNKRNWRYISAILENWAAEGKASGTHQRDSKKADPDKYIKGRYGHMVRR